jgi:hypothetical protein
MWSAYLFLDTLNNALNNWRQHDRTTPSNCTWAQPVHAVVVGCCSNHMNSGPIVGVILSIRREGVPLGNTVLVLSDCCGQYSGDDQEKIRLSLPGITFLFPDQPDFCGSFQISEINAYKLAKCLIDSGVLNGIFPTATEITPAAS